MRIAILGSITSSWTCQLAARMKSLGHHVSLISFIDSLDGDDYLKGNKAATSGSQNKMQNIGVTVHLIDAPGKGFIKYFFAGQKVRKAAESDNADLLLATYAGGFGFSVFCSRFRPYAVYTVGCDVLSVKGIKKWMTKIVLSHADVIVSNGKHLCNQTAALVPERTVHLGLLGIDPGYFISEKNKNNTKVKLVCTRGFTEIYNNTTIIKALKLIPLSVAFEMVFTSSGPLLETSKELGASDSRIKFLGGVDDKTLLESLKDADIFISASRSDGSSISVQEAMSCNCYAVLSDIPANKEWLEEDIENITLVPTFDQQQWTDQLTRVIDSPKLREAGGKRNRQLILKYADGMKNTKELMTIFEGIK